jgi:hypothetical protein
MIESWKELYEKIGTFTGVSNALAKKGVSISRDTIQKKIREKFESEGKDFKKWKDQYNRNPSKLVHVTNKDVELWQGLYEKYGMYDRVIKHLAKSGVSVSITTIRDRLQAKFKKEGKNFEKWKEQYNKDPTKSAKHTGEDLECWRELYENLGIFTEVSHTLKEMGFLVSREVILSKLQKKFKNEGKDFERWRNKYSKYKYRPVDISKEDIEAWQELYEKFGTYGEVERVLAKKGVSVTRHTIKDKLRDKFECEGKDFVKWSEIYSQYKGEYLPSEEEIENWITLYESFGSFQGIAKILQLRNKNTPVGATIKKKLKEWFYNNGNDFDEWVKIYGNDFFHEEICRRFFERLFGLKFNRATFDWLRNDITGSKMHLDGYNEILKLAFEYNGIQHYKFVERFHKTYQGFLNRQRLDARKIRLCKEYNVSLIIIPYTIEITEWQDEIIRQYEKLTNQRFPKIKKIDVEQLLEDYKLDKQLRETPNW